MVRTVISVYIGKIIGFISRTLQFGSGFTWSGEIAMRIDPTVISVLAAKVETIILVAGTNGKTTTTAMLKTLLSGKAFSNTSGANLLNGIAGALIAHVSPVNQKKKGTAIFEVDEAVLPAALVRLQPAIVIILNLFRDQLDRYGEVNTIVKNWHHALTKLPQSTTVILNADDPQVAFLGEKLRARVRYVGIEKTGVKSSSQGELWGDSLYCPSCGSRLHYHDHIFSHLGNWQCSWCGLKRPALSINAGMLALSIIGVHNQYNAAAAILAAQAITRHSVDTLLMQLDHFKPAFGRMETLATQASGKVTIMLSKNPTGLNENIRLLASCSDVGAVLLVLNDRIPDGTDVSWIWDVDFEPLIKKSKPMIASGDRAYDLGVRLKYQISNTKDQRYSEQIKICINLKEALMYALDKTGNGETLYILPTYSAMLEVRRIALGRKIL